MYDAGNVKRLAKYLTHLSTGGSETVEDDPELMLKCVNDATERIFKDYTAVSVEERRNEQTFTVLLTGATGVLGAHILDLLVANPAVKKIFCLVRASSAKQAATRVDESLKKRLKPGLDETSGKIECLPAALGENKFGLEDSDFQAMQRDTNLIIHVCTLCLPCGTVTDEAGCLECEFFPFTQELCTGPHWRSSESFPLQLAMSTACSNPILLVNSKYFRSQESKDPAREVIHEFTRCKQHRIFQEQVGCRIHLQRL